MDWNDSGILDAIRRVAQTCKKATKLMKRHPWCLNMCFEEAVVLAGSKSKVVIIRIVLGDLLEEHAKAQALSIASPCVSKKTLGGGTGGGRLCQLYFDACAVAVWTSAHVQFLDILNQTSEPLAEPSIFLVPNAFTTLDFAVLYERKSGAKTLPSESKYLMQLISRCTNPGARGWEPVIEHACKCNIAKRVLVKEIEVCLLALHPQLHPCLRPNWRARQSILKFSSFFFSTESSNSELWKASLFLKETMRRCVCTMLSNVPAMHASLASFLHPGMHLNQPPMNFAHSSLEAAMAAFAMTSEEITSMPAEAHPQDHFPLAEVLTRQFKRASESTTGMAWSPGWLGKGTISLLIEPPLTTFSELVWMQSFKAPFLSLWIHAMTHGVRLLKLDQVQHQSINELTSATRLCQQLPTADQLAIQRLVLNTPTASLLTIREVLTALGYQHEKLGRFTTDLKNTQQVLLKIKNALGERAVAQLLFFGRVAWLLSKMFIVKFSDRISNAQCKVLLRRSKREVPTHFYDNIRGQELLDFTYSKLPSQATCLCVCAECQRVANATVVSGVGDEKKIAAFNEFGLTQAMVRYSDLGSSEECLYCAKRSSASLRSSQAFQKKMTELEIECEAVNEDEVKKFFAQSEADPGLASRIRRDSKNAIEQRSITSSCGTSKMLQIPIIGKAVYIYGACYTLCGKCACILKVTDVHRYEHVICCLRCDASMVTTKATQDSCHVACETSLDNGKSSIRGQTICRYCGSTDPQRSGIRWKEINAPLDCAGGNADLPAPLRKVYYCPNHNKPWLVQAHRVMETKIILAHLSTNARPIFETEEATEEAHGAAPGHLGDAPRAKPKRTRRVKNSSSSKRLKI